MAKNVLIIGGTGLIGQTISKLLEKNPNINKYIGTRKTKTDEHLYIDVQNVASFTNIIDKKICLIIMCTRDKNDEILKYSIKNGIDYLDITRPTPELEKSLSLIDNNSFSNRIVFCSGWMGGIVPILINNSVPNLNQVQDVKIITYYSTKDKAGKSSADFMSENADKYFNYYKNNTPIKTKHFLGDENYCFKYDNKERKISDFDIPDLFILNHFENVPNVIAKLSFNSQFINYTLTLMQKIRLFKIMIKQERKLIFGGSGKGDLTFFEIIVKDNNSRINTIGLKSLKGQSELTAFSTVLHIEKILEDSLQNGMYFGHNIHRPQEFIKRLTSNDSLILY